MGATAVVQGQEPDTRGGPQTSSRSRRAAVSLGAAAASDLRSVTVSATACWSGGRLVLPFFFAWGSPHRPYTTLEAAKGQGSAFPWVHGGGELGGTLPGSALGPPGLSMA